MEEIIQLVQENSLHATDTGYEINLHLLWYRSLPVSCIEKIQLSLDGEPVDQSSMRFGINGHQYKLDELADLVEEFWFIQDTACLSIIQPGKVIRGSQHKIDIDLKLRFPYIPIGPGKFLTHINRYTGVFIAI